MTWTIDLFEIDGTPHATDVPFASAAVTWALDGSGSVEVDIPSPDMGTQWAAGLRQIRVKQDATVRFGGYLEHLARSGAPDQERYRAAGLGLASILDRRVVHGDFTRTDVVATTIAWNLIQHAQAQTDGNHGFTLGTVVGTAPSRTRHMCDGDVISEQIGQLAEMEPGGFFWEIDPTGVFNAWVGDRGGASGLTLAESDAILFEVTADTSDLLTYVTALGTSDEPCGGPLEVRYSSLRTTYGRREETVDADTRLAAELDQLADHELMVRGRARIGVKASWIERAGRRPWAFGDVWLGDTLTVDLEEWFGGSQTMRVVTVNVSLETAAADPFVTYELQAV